jgi:ribulose-5-phosphate 4-epimerase/fuculose-1-phosphate aldolase
MHDEKGYIQFQCNWVPAEPPAVPPALISWRNQLFSLDLIGVYPDGIGFGNVSTRTTGTQFVISGTATGQLPVLDSEHFAEVTAFDIRSNAVTCRGRVKASSESLSHAAVYLADPTACAVFHVHHLSAWESLRGRLPTTDSIAEAGTPEMADAIAALLADPGVVAGGVFIMGGHREGIMAFGPDLDAAAHRLLRLIHSP